MFQAGDRVDIPDRGLKGLSLPPWSVLIVGLASTQGKALSEKSERTLLIG